MLTYEKCLELTKRKPTKKLENNTYLETLKLDTFGVKLHDTYVVTIGKETYELNSGGWRTLTTKDRINKYAPVRLGQEKGLWYLYSSQFSKRALFYDGILLNKDGEIISEVVELADTEKKKRKLDRMVSAYIKGFVQHIKEGKLEDPSMGDCWGCCMSATGNIMEEPMGYSHYISHFEDKYYVPSLLWNAFKGRSNPGFIWSCLRSSPESYAHFAQMNLQHFFS